ncbi:unnamed protein product [Blepharisma stoltei]|uniref:Uncharacterized protein n=1 Tax=Blepharisma stoltei TaxID=1481888 RepID=A0AAU9K3H2_9CILI|nr:unnamed protein product [Blepharisma stoltei]
MEKSFDLPHSSPSSIIQSYQCTTKEGSEQSSQKLQDIYQALSSLNIIVSGAKIDWEEIRLELIRTQHQDQPLNEDEAAEIKIKHSAIIVSLELQPDLTKKLALFDSKLKEIDIKVKLISEQMKHCIEEESKNVDALEKELLVQKLTKGLKSLKKDALKLTAEKEKLLSELENEKSKHMEALSSMSRSTELQNKMISQFTQYKNTTEEKFKAMERNMKTMERNMNEAEVRSRQESEKTREKRKKDKKERKQLKTEINRLRNEIDSYNKEIRDLRNIIDKLQVENANIDFELREASLKSLHREVIEHIENQLCDATKSFFIRKPQGFWEIDLFIEDRNVNKEDVNSFMDSFLDRNYSFTLGDLPQLRKYRKSLHHFIHYKLANMKGIDEFVAALDPNNESSAWHGFLQKAIQNKRNSSGN